MRTRAGLVVLGLLLVTACSGHSPAPHRSSSEPSPVVVPTVAQASGENTSGPSATCAAGEVTAVGAPFCYPLPHGFADHSAATDYATGWQWRTLVSIGPHDLIQVIGHPVQADLDTLTPVDTLNFMQTLELSTTTPGVLTVTPLTNVTVNGGRAFRQDAQYAIGVDTQNYTILRGHSVVSISCQFTPSEAKAVTAACADVLATIDVVDR